MAKSPRLRARWRRRYNRSLRRPNDGVSLRKWERAWAQLVNGPEQRRSWGKFIAEWDAYFALPRDRRSEA